MNKMNRAMNTGEKILMIIFALLVIGGVYYYFVYSPVQKDLVNQSFPWSCVTFRRRSRTCAI